MRCNFNVQMKIYIFFAFLARQRSKVWKFANVGNCYATAQKKSIAEKILCKAECRQKMQENINWASWGFKLHAVADKIALNHTERKFIILHGRTVTCTAIYVHVIAETKRTNFLNEWTKTIFFLISAARKRIQEQLALIMAMRKPQCQSYQERPWERHTPIAEYFCLRLYAQTHFHA